MKHKPSSSVAVLLREVRTEDLDLFFEHQLDPEANLMAAFTAKNPSDRQEFDTHWAKILNDPLVEKRTILAEGKVAGYVSSYEMFGLPSVGYWIGRKYWGKGVATKALLEFIAKVQIRPLYARVAKDNRASIRVLEKCGFSISSEDHGYANARGRDTEEFVMKIL